MEPKKIRLIIFCIILSIPVGILLFHIIWVITLDKGDPLLKTIRFLDLNLMLSIPLIGFIYYVIDKKFEHSEKGEDSRKIRIKDFTKAEKIIASFIFIGIIFVSLSIIIGEYFLISLGSNLYTDIFIIFEYIGWGLLAVGGILLLF